MPPCPPDPPAAAEHHSQRAVHASVPPLGLIAVTFFMPFFRICGDMRSPATYLEGESVLGWLWLAPRFATAALLALVLGWAVLRRTPPGRAGLVAALLGLGACWVSLVLEWGLVLQDLRRHGPDLHWVAWLLAATVAGGLLSALGLTRRGWTRWSFWIAAYAALASPLCWWVVEAIRQGGAPGRIGAGAYLYVAALALLGGAFTLGRCRLARPRRV